jgi:hypothetical protein
MGMGGPGLLLALSPAATDQLVAAVGLVLVLSVAGVVAWAYRTNAMSGHDKRRLRRRAWTVIRGGRPAAPMLKPRSKKPRQRRSGS